MPGEARAALVLDALRRCNECGLCLPHCPTYRLTGDETASPRGRLNAMREAASGAVATATSDFVAIMALCLQCRACEAACPSLVPFGRAMAATRAETGAATRRGRIRRGLAGSLFPSRPILRVATLGAALLQRLRAPVWLWGRGRRAVRGLRPLPWKRRSTLGAVFAAAGDERGVAGLLAGCVMDPWFSEVHDAAIDLLRRCGYRVIVPGDQTCCGALAAHEGAESAARRLAASNLAAFSGVDVIVADAAGCSAHLKEYRDWAGADAADSAPRVADITELVAAAITDGRLPRLLPTGTPVAVQDPCHLRHVQRLGSAARTIVEAAGYRTVEIDPDGLCCGAAGLYSLLRLDPAHRLGLAKARQIVDSEARLVASANPGCEMQLRSHLGDEYRIQHPVEIYAAALGRMPSSPRKEP